MLTGDALFEALSQMVDAHPAGEDSPTMGMIDGMMAALAVSPEPVPPDEWLPRIGLGPDDLFVDPGYASRFREALLARQTDIVASLLQGGLVFAPYYDVDENDETLWQFWLVGFIQTMALRQKAWDKLFRTRDEDLATALSGLVALAATFPGLSDAAPEIDKSEIAEMAEQAPDLIPYFVEVIYRRRHGLPRVVLTDEWGFDEAGGEGWDSPSLAVKVGRNEPCPCGSGKKFKKCCGG